MAASEADICNLALLRIGQNTDLLGALDDPGDTAAACALVYAQKRDRALREYRYGWAQRTAILAQLGGTTYAAGTTFARGAYCSYAPSASNVVNAPESLTTFVYLSLQANNTGNTPDTSPTFWRQISRPEWAYCFLLPTDWLDIRGLYHGNRNPREDQQVPYELAYEPSPGPGTILLSDGVLPGEAVGSSSGSTSASVELRYTAQVSDVRQFPPDFVEALAWDIAAELALALRKDPDAALKCGAQARAAWAEAIANSKRNARKDPAPVPSYIAARRGRSGRSR